MQTDLQQHWQQIYQTKKAEEVSWTERVPGTSLSFIKGLDLPKDAAIIDIGGGDSRLAECLLDEGYTDITVLDISEESLERARKRLGDRAGSIKWVISDVRDFRPERVYAVWHDRAAFHFLLNDEDVEAYRTLVEKWATGYLVVGTFSENGPKKCSGLPVRQYSIQQLSELFRNRFKKIRCRHVQHRTPANALQEFTFCLMQHLPI